MELIVIQRRKPLTAPEQKQYMATYLGCTCSYIVPQVVRSSNGGDVEQVAFACEIAPEWLGQCIHWLQMGYIRGLHMIDRHGVQAVIDGHTVNQVGEGNDIIVVSPAPVGFRYRCRCAFILGNGGRSKGTVSLWGSRWRCNRWFGNDGNVWGYRKN